MLRAINTTTLSCCKNIKLQNNKASLSTLSFNPSLFNYKSNGTQSSYHLDVSRISAVQSSPSALTTIPSTLTKTYKQITSQISNYLIATLSSGDLTLVTIDNIERKIDEIEENVCWEDVSSTPLIMMEESSTLDELSIWQISTLKRRKKMMNKHKLRKRKKKMRLKTRK